MRRIYWWELWFGSSRTVLTCGVDYHCSQSAMAGMIRNSASKHGVRVSLTDKGSSIVIEVVGEVLDPNKASIAS